MNQENMTMKNVLTTDIKIHKVKTDRLARIKRQVHSYSHKSSK